MKILQNLIIGGARYYLITESRDLADFGADHAHSLSSIASRNFHHFRILAVMSEVEGMDYTPSGDEANKKKPTADGNDATKPPQMPPDKDMKTPLDSSGGDTPDVEGTVSGREATPDVEGTASGRETTEKEQNATVEGGNRSTTQSPNNDLKPKRPLESGDTSGSMAKINSKKDAGSDEDHKSKKPKNPEGSHWSLSSWFNLKRFSSQPSYSKGIMK